MTFSDAEGNLGYFKRFVDPKSCKNNAYVHWMYPMPVFDDAERDLFAIAKFLKILHVFWA